MRSRHPVPTSPEERVQRRLRTAENPPPPWASGGSSDNGPLRTIRGTINTTGPTIVVGGGFTINSKIGTGEVVIAWDNWFSAAPTVVATAGAGIVDHNAVDNGTTSCRLRRYNDAGTVTDGRIDFIAIGPG